MGRQQAAAQERGIALLCGGGTARLRSCETEASGARAGIRRVRVGATLARKTKVLLF